MDRKKPARKCPLYLHRNGQWAKRINGKIRYFGTDQAEAVKLWSEHSTRIRNGQLPRSGDHSPTLAELGNVYAEHRKRDIKTGEFAERSYHEMLKTIERLIKWIGRDSQPSTLGPNDFFAIKEKMFEPVIKTRFARGKNHGRKTKRRSVVTVDGDIRRIRAFFGWCLANRYLQRAPDYGAAFKLASAKVLRKERAKSKRHLFSADEIRKILDQAKPDFRPIILFGINAGVGAGDLGYWDLSQLPDLDQADVWVDLPRRKTGIDRRFLLWPETVSALKSYLEKRNPPRDGSSVVFVTRSRLKWYREHGASKQDSIGQAFIAARKRAGLKKGTFYDLRRTFRTIAGNSLDIEAVMHIMGHVAPETDMSARYRLAIPDVRLKKVSDVVRLWLWPGLANNTQVASAGLQQ